MASHPSVSSDKVFKQFVDLLARQSAREWVESAAVAVSTATTSIACQAKRCPPVCASGTAT